AERRAGRLTDEELCEAESCMSRSSGHCMVMGTASTMASMVEALGMTLPGNAAIPAPDSRRLAQAELAGRRAVEMAKAGGPKPSEILTARAFDNAIRAGDRKRTRLNSSHVSISYAVFCLKKKIEVDCHLSLQARWHPLI